jgi:hypothetical protein
MAQPRHLSVEHGSDLRLALCPEAWNESLQPKYVVVYSPVDQSLMRLHVQPHNTSTSTCGGGRRYPAADFESCLPSSTPIHPSIYTMSTDTIVVRHLTHPTGRYSLYLSAYHLSHNSMSAAEEQFKRMTEVAAAAFEHDTFNNFMVGGNTNPKVLRLLQESQIRAGAIGGSVSDECQVIRHSRSHERSGIRCRVRSGRHLRCCSLVGPGEELLSRLYPSSLLWFYLTDSASGQPRTARSRLEQVHGRADAGIPTVVDRNGACRGCYAP